MGEREVAEGMSSRPIGQALDSKAPFPPRLGRYPAEYPADGLARISLTQGHSAIVDAADVDRLCAFRWCATVTKSGHVYAMRRAKGADGKRHAIMMHRAVLDATPGLDVDHINGDTLDNRRSNLRLASRSQNAANRHREIASSSTYRGVHPNHRGGRWRASITHQGQRLLLGSFDTREQAAAAYNAAALRLFGEFASPNTVPTAPEPRA